MGFLGMSLVFVGIVLLGNGVCALNKTDPKSMSFMNLIVGVFLIIANLIALNKASTNTDYINVTSGFLFGITYLFITANLLKGLDRRPFGWYSLCVAVYATVMGIMSFVNGGIWMGILWIVWAVLWLEGFVELVLKVEKLGAVYPYLAIFEGIFATFVPGLLMLFNVWPA